MEAHQQYAEAKASYGEEVTMSELGYELGEAMDNGDFEIQLHYMVHMNGKLILQKILPDTTCRSFNIMDFEEQLVIQIEQAVGNPDFEVLTCTAIIKHESGCGGAKQHDIEAFSIPAAEEILVLLECQ